MATQLINLSFPEDLVKKIDRAAKNQYASRSEYIRQSVVSRLKTQDLDVWEELASGADELKSNAKKAGYVTDIDFNRAVKEIRQSARK